MKSGDVPIKHIVRNKKRYSSGFGYRIHPITKKKSFHAGIEKYHPLNIEKKKLISYICRML